MSLAAYMDEVRQRAAAATAGPWGLRGDGGVQIDGSRDWYWVCGPNGRRLHGPCFAKADGRFVVAAREDIPRLLAVIDALLEEREAIGRAIDALDDYGALAAADIDDRTLSRLLEAREQASDRVQALIEHGTDALEVGGGG